MSEDTTLEEFIDRGDGSITEGEKYLERRLGPVVVQYPTDWTIQQMESIYSDKSIGTNERGNEGSKQVPLIKMGDLGIGTLSIDNPEMIDNANELLNEYQLNQGDLLFNTRNTPELVGKTAVWDGRYPAVYDNNLLRVRFKSGISPRFVNYFLSMGPGWRQLKSRVQGTTSVAAIYDGEFDKIEVPLPKSTEQHKIATILHTIDQSIEKTDEIIEARKCVKRGLMQDIFKYGVNEDRQLRNQNTDSKPYKETKYGRIPKEWEIVPLNQLVPEDAPIVYGILKPGDHHPNGVPVVKVKDIHDGEIKQDDLLYTSPEIHEDYKRAELREGDLLFTIRGTVGRMAFVPENLDGGNITQDTARIRVTEANPRYIRYFFETETPNNYFERNTIGQAVQGINLEDLREVPVHLPSKEEQSRIVELLDSHSDALRNERDYRQRLQRLKQGLMQDLLSGTVRTADTTIQVPDEIAQHG